NMLSIVWIGARARVSDEAHPRLLADVRALRSALRRHSLGRSDDRRTPQDSAMAVTGPLDRTDPAGRRVGGPRVVLRPLRAGRAWDAESLEATDGPRHGRSIPVDPEPDRLVPRLGPDRSLPPSQLRVRGSDRRRPGDPGARRHGPRREDPGDSVRGRVSRLQSLRPAVDPAPAETSELNRHARGGVRAGAEGRGGSGWPAWAGAPGELRQRAAPWPFPN